MLAVAEPDDGDEYRKIEQELKQISERKLELHALQEELEGGVSHNGRRYTLVVLFYT